MRYLNVFDKKKSVIFVVSQFSAPLKLNTMPIKPGQRKRKAAKRTTTPKRKVVKINTTPKRKVAKRTTTPKPTEYRKHKKSGESKVISEKRFTTLSKRYSKQKGSKTLGTSTSKAQQVISGRNPKKSVSVSSRSKPQRPRRLKTKH